MGVFLHRTAACASSPSSCCGLPHRIVPTALNVPLQPSDYNFSVAASSSAIQSFFLHGPAGRLEALLNLGIENPSRAALVCHPHPLYGGTLHNKVVFHTMKALNGFGFPVLRFNFRGAGLSEGEHDYGRGEIEDVRTALDWLKKQYRQPIVFAGFSFGAAIGLRAACPDPRVEALIGLGTPLAPIDERLYDYAFLGDSVKPKLFVSGACDRFGPRAELERFFQALSEPKKLILVESADHFFAGHLHQVREAIAAWVKELIASTQ